LRSSPFSPNHGAALGDDATLRADQHGHHHSSFQLVIRDQQSGSASIEGFGGGGHGGAACTLAAQVFLGSFNAMIPLLQEKGRFNSYCSFWRAECGLRVLVCHRQRSVRSCGSGAVAVTFSAEKLIAEAALGGSARNHEDRDLFLAALAIFPLMNCPLVLRRCPQPAAHGALCRQANPPPTPTCRRFQDKVKTGSSLLAITKKDITMF
jgi:hypothetical protein